MVGVSHPSTLSRKLGTSCRAILFDESFAAQHVAQTQTAGCRFLLMMFILGCLGKDPLQPWKRWNARAFGGLQRAAFSANRLAKPFHCTITCMLSTFVKYLCCHWSIVATDLPDKGQKK